MNANIADFRNPQTIRRLGMKALVKELGPVGMAYFIRQFEPGEGDYTAEREGLLKDVSMDDILRDLEVMRTEENRENRSRDVSQSF
ncbi:MAG: hypothetical protein LBJ46_01595 [Planctomycetota bacterium]|jgi:hypothetical protein|nr:hypothetical protein [Planctomycetota bacterium]